MKIIRTIRALRKALAAIDGSIGFVPTMGYFHEGHLSLMRTAKRNNACAVVSLFVNPTQFGPTEDLSRYPRDLARDAGLARTAGVDIMFVPTVEEMYPAGASQTVVEVGGIAGILCGAVRPGHFCGVATVVSKLINIVLPDVMYLGQKDFQQTVVIKRMVSDLNFPLRVVVCPTVREPDGLAMSSRNSYLSPTERMQATAIYRALQMARSMAAAGESDAGKIIFKIKKLILDETSATIEYVNCVSVADLQDVRRITGKVLIVLAVKFPSARLIDNAVIELNVDEKVRR
ncbi:MAG: pantoate--beta-alanine ligase [Candidatus Omnitrophica bacterium]|nr:pantoate--beta-alanine ligase [Candidatus Omnitrophota bacterium]